jgi:hypothetical protein
MWAQSGLTAQRDRGRAAISVTLPAELLSRRDYVIKVSGIKGEREPEPLASYSFRVTCRDRTQHTDRERAFTIARLR